MSYNSSRFHSLRRATGFNLLTLIFVFAAIVQPVSAHAQDEWQWRATIYAWLPTIKAQTQFPTGGDTPDLEVDTSDILGGLDFTFMGTLKARKGTWGFFTDVMYLDVGGQEKASRDLTVGPNDLPAGIDAKVNLDLKSWVWTVAGTYNLSASARNEIDLLAGARMFDMKQTVKWTFNGTIDDLPLPERSGSSVVSVTDWDAIIGVIGHTFIGDDSNWFIPYYLDVGTGDSDLTWQAMTGLGYKFNWGATEFTYRYLDYDPSSSSPMTDLSVGGVMLGATFQW